MKFIKKMAINLINRLIDLKSILFTVKRGHNTFESKYWMIQNKYAHLTMIPSNIYVENLKLVEKFSENTNVVVECGTWKGGMLAGISEILNQNCFYHFFDSFEGLPEAKEYDGRAALQWQANKSSNWYFDNCTAEVGFVFESIKLAGISKYEIHKGWFNDTVPKFAETINSISILRLDGDWYDSTIICLQHLFPLVKKGGLIIIDDYLTWDGCSKAVHDYLSSNKRNEKIQIFNNKVCFIQKLE